jgi:molybdate transport system regulatory protein
MYMTTEINPAEEPPSDALLLLRGAGRLPVGRDRIAMLQAVAAHGSITAAAKALGYSYKAVWDGLAAINNLLPRPALQTQSGGRGGGGAILTEEGHRLVAAFRRLEERLSAISASIAREGAEALQDPRLWSFAMKTSARNAFHCEVAAVTRAAVNAQVELQVTDTSRIFAVITRQSAPTICSLPRGAVSLRWSNRPSCCWRVRATRRAFRCGTGWMALCSIAWMAVSTPRSKSTLAAARR